MKILKQLNEKQARPLSLLIEYFQTGDLNKWDETNLAWIASTEFGSHGNSYSPIGQPGSANGEVVFRSGQAWRFLGGTSDKWVKHTVSFSPFTEGGGNKTEFRDKTIRTDIKIQRNTYRWDPLFQKWTFVSSTNL